MRTRAWGLSLAIDPRAGEPVFLQIARGVTEAIRSGRLRPGEPLPGSRRLAETLGVHRNTVLAALSELEAEGWIATQPARGTFVSEALPEQKPRRFRPAGAQPSPERVGFPLPPPSVQPLALAPRGKGVLSLAGGLPDPRLVPVDELARAYRRALRGRDGRALVDYGDPQGLVRLRAALAAMLAATRGLPDDPTQLIVTRGSQMALYLCARALVRPGDAVAVEALGYRPAWDALRQAGAELHPVPVDAGGLDVDALEALARKRPLRALYLTPHHQYPTTATLEAPRRLRLLALAAAQRFAILEDDYDHEFHYQGRPLLPLASADPAGVVLYLGTLSKILAPGLRLGYVRAPRPVIERLTLLRRSIDRQGDHAVEHAVAELLEDGVVARHARRARREYQARRDALCAALGRELGGALSFEVPTGGIALWARADGIDVDAWAERAIALGVSFYPGRRFAFAEPGRARFRLRLGFAACTPAELAEAARRLRRALPPVTPSVRRAREP